MTPYVDLRSQDPQQLRQELAEGWTAVERLLDAGRQDEALDEARMLTWLAFTKGYPAEAGPVLRRLLPLLLDEAKERETRRHSGRLLEQALTLHLRTCPSCSRGWLCSNFVAMQLGHVTKGLTRWP